MTPPYPLQVRRASISFVGAPMDNNLLFQDSRQVRVCHHSSSLKDNDEGEEEELGGLPTSSLVQEDVTIDFTVQHPVCGEVMISGRLSGDNDAIPGGTVLTMKTRVPTIALANKCAAVDYVHKVIESVVVKKSPRAPEGWKMTISRA